MMNPNIYEYIIEARMADLRRQQRAGEFVGRPSRRRIRRWWTAAVVVPKVLRLPGQRAGVTDTRLDRG